MIEAVNQPIAYLYCVTNNLNGMQYIGVSKNPKKRFNSHINQKQNPNLYLKNAINKYGKESFNMEILVKGTQEYCYLIENKTIQKFNTLHPHGYNLAHGGRGGFGLFGEKNGAFGRKGSLHPMFGKRPSNADRPVSDETREKMRVARIAVVQRKKGLI
jgi:group I intron endonuclease